MNHSITQRPGPRDPQHEVSPAPAAALALIWSRSSKLKELWVVVQAIEAWPDVAITPDRCGLRLTRRNVTLGRLRWDGRIDLRFAPQVADRLVDERMASRDPSEHGGRTGRVVFDVRTVDDANWAVWLLRLAYLSMNSSLDGLRRCAIRP